MLYNFLFRKVKIFGTSVSLIIVIWFLLAAIAVTVEILRSSINNYYIFEGVFWHTWRQTPLYTFYPDEYFDTNHYGSFFSVVIAPFALLPRWLGCLLWSLANAYILLFSIKKIDISDKFQLFIVAITAIEMMTSIHNVQSNPLIAALLILAFVMIEKENDFWGAFFIAAGFFIKLYGIAGLLFFLFSKHKINFIAYFLFWCAALFALPMIFSSPAFIIQSYKDWYGSLVEKNQLNSVLGGMTDISVIGMIRRIIRVPLPEVLSVIIPAAVLMFAPLLRFKQYKSKDFRLNYLALILISVVLFSSSSESSTYVIAVAGVGIWYILNVNKQARWSNIILVFVLIITSLSITDLFPRYLKENLIRAYSLKALPCFIVWIWIIADLSFTNFINPEKRLQEAQ